MDQPNPQFTENKPRWLLLTSPSTSPIALPVRTVLGDLPAIPMKQIPKPSATTKTTADIPPSTPKIRPLSPPLTPEKIESISAGIRPYSKKYKLHEQLGYGVWSNVYRATEATKPALVKANLPPSPPISPTSVSSASSASDGKVLAVKRPSRRDAHKVLEKEAKILTIIHSHKEASAHLTHFHGYDAEQRSIIMDAVPLSLESYVKATRKQPIFTPKMFDPVIGAEQWAAFAEKLTSGLAFLHSHGCIHGDIKPANILLRTEENGKITPLYCDFSSSHIISPDTPIAEIEEVTAVTTDYTSPELLESLKHRNNARAIATYASDVFALGVTLLFAAIGESPYAGARMEIQRLAMAKMGSPMEFARGGDQALRVSEERAVAKALKGGLAKKVEERMDVEEWREEVSRVVKDWEEGGWVRGG